MCRLYRDELLPYRCVEVEYIHTLLKHGYGFPGDSRNITFVLNIDGMEVEWTLGYALAEVPADMPPSALAGDAGMAWWGPKRMAEPLVPISILVACVVVIAAVVRACPTQDKHDEQGTDARSTR